MPANTFAQGYAVGQKRAAYIIGTPLVGNVLTVRAPGFISPTYQWTRDGVNINGETNASYTVTNTDVGSTLLCKVASNTVNHFAVAVPLTNNAKIMGLGHSFIQRGAFSRYAGAGLQPATGDNQGYQTTARGVLNYVAAADGRFNLDMFATTTHPYQSPASQNALDGSEQGVGGDHLLASVAPATGALGTIPRSTYALARTPDVVYLEIGTNDINSGVTGNAATDPTDNSATKIIYYYDQQVSRLTSAGRWVILQTISTRTDWPLGDARYTTLDTVNNWIIGQAGRNKVLICDTRTLDANTTIRGIQTREADGIHGTTMLMSERGKVLLPLLQSLVAFGDPRNLDPLSNTPTANIYPYAGLPGTAGTKGTGVTGNVATSHNISRVSGTSTYACSKEVITTGNEKQVITVTPAGTAGAIDRVDIKTTVTMLLADLGLAAGDWVECYLPVELDDWAGWDYYDTSGSSAASFFNEVYDNTPTFRWEANAAMNARNTVGSPLILAAKLLIPTGVSANRIRYDSRPIQIRHRSDVAGTGVAKIGSPILRKLATDPRTVWNLP